MQTQSIIRPLQAKDYLADKHFLSCVWEWWVMSGIDFGRSVGFRVSRHIKNLETPISTTTLPQHKKSHPKRKILLLKTSKQPWRSTSYAMPLQRHWASQPSINLLLHFWRLLTEKAAAVVQVVFACCVLHHSQQVHVPLPRWTPHQMLRRRHRQEV